LRLSELLGNIWRPLASAALAGGATFLAHSTLLAEQPLAVKFVVAAFIMCAGYLAAYQLLPGGGGRLRGLLVSLKELCGRRKMPSGVTA